MTSNKKLRDAIARAIFDVRDDEFDLDEWDDLDSTDRERYTCDAQAIIDSGIISDLWDEGYEAGSNDTYAWQDATEGYTDVDEYEGTHNPYRDN